jgi:valyl-tRNA synthetase
VVAAPPHPRATIPRPAVDLAAVGRIENLSFTDGEELAVTEIELAEQQA